MNPTYNQILDAIGSLPLQNIQGKEGVYLGDLLRFFHANNAESELIRQKLLSMELKGDVVLLRMGPPGGAPVIGIRLNS